MSIDTILTRGVENIYPTKDELEKILATGKKLKIYFGIDPTGPTLHIGHAATLLKLREFQEEGHEIIILIGDFTAMIGDPTDKGTARIRLTREQVESNLKHYREQIGKIIDLEKTKFVFNNEWLGKLTFTEVVELASEFTVGQMLERDMFQERIKSDKPIYLHEFLYPLMQGYDSVALGVDMEIGGNDQTFNMLAGRTMLKRRGKEKFVLTNKLLVDPTGKKMGKTEGNMVTLNDAPDEMYGKVMSWPDSLLPLAFEICTRLSLPEMVKLTENDPKEAKMKLAYEIVRFYHSEEAAKEAEEYFVNTFSKKEVPTDLTEIKPSAYDIVTILIEAGFVKSNSEARREIEKGGVKVDGENISDPKQVVVPEAVVQKGKRFFVKVK
jgi:tyrosyl-tRNA synthetase